MRKSERRRVVIVVGAGATRAEFLARQRSAAKKPPLDADFFQLTRKLRQRSPDVRSGFKRLERYLGRELISDGMEAIFNEVYLDLLAKRTPKAANAAMVDLIQLFRYSLGYTTDNLDCTRKSPTYELLRTLRRSVVRCEDIAIVSFNQDLIVEKALDRLRNRGDLNWHLPACYCAKFEGWTDPSGPQGIFELDDDDSDFRVLKLHGSMNWYRQTAGRKPGSVRSDRARVYCTSRKLIGERPWTLTRTSKNSNRSKWYTWPVVVPPIFDKHQWLSGLLKPVWDTAEVVLDNSSLVVFWGYSFPQADYLAADLFRKTLRTDGSSQRRILAINPDPSVVARLWDITAGNPIELYGDVDAAIRGL